MYYMAIPVKNLDFILKDFRNSKVSNKMVHDCIIDHFKKELGVNVVKVEFRTSFVRYCMDAILHVEDSNEYNMLMLCYGEF